MTDQQVDKTEELGLDLTSHLKQPKIEQKLHTKNNGFQKKVHHARKDRDP